jgi:hypothetical protein
MNFGTSPLELLAAAAMLKGLCYLDEFTYGARFDNVVNTGLAANGQQQVGIPINSDSDFIAIQYNLEAWSTAGTLVNQPDLLLLLTRTGAGRNIMDNAVPVINLCGNYAFTDRNYPGFLPISSLHQGNGLLMVQLTNRTATNFNTGTARIDFTMRGFKVFYQTNAQGQTGNRQDIFHAL